MIAETSTQSMKGTLEMKHPSRSDYDVHVDGSYVVVLFKPTESYYSFSQLDPSQWAEYGPVSSTADVRHAKFGDTGEYVDGEVGSLALNIARNHVSKTRGVS